jgi:hypothetical protein
MVCSVYDAVTAHKCCEENYPQQTQAEGVGRTWSRAGMEKPGKAVFEVLSSGDDGHQNDIACIEKLKFDVTRVR